jgi:hypothetical protein
MHRERALFSTPERACAAVRVIFPYAVPWAKVVHRQGQIMGYEAYYYKANIVEGVPTPLYEDEVISTE